MLPSHTNFSGKIHGGYILSLLDQIAFAYASKFSGNYCVTASVDTVDFLNPIEVGELVTIKASVNYVGESSMIIVFELILKNIQTGKTKHCNSSYFTLVAKDACGNKVVVLGLLLTNFEEVRLFNNSIKIIALKKDKNHHEEVFNYKSDEGLKALKNSNVQLVDF